MPGRRSLDPVTRKRAILSRGAHAEEAVADYLAARGLEILEVNLHVGRFEIDVLARDGAVLAIVEVRTRGPGSWQRALTSIDGRKRARLRAAGSRLWRERYAHRTDIERIRFDVAAVTFTAEGVIVEHIPAAF